ncbi:phage regulatory protein/antirepressor Ant [Clostridium pasteurianum]|uniref:Phage antirepressor KilAC-like protein n=1 Tax=Clostridium pasteurianum BC1 TaxID=86416 RepID=R4K7G1_CLOPA|nr:phage regulatory protein/antirepressor Ant [Clostridium pasteurianum]AGK97646.1 phage antirepressor KilAC-like protein [Clostridium pasteurianum BC1]
MENILTIKGNETGVFTIDSREVAEMMGVTHDQILRKLDGAKDRRGIIEILTDNQMVASEYFIEYTYIDNSGKENKCYLFTKMGCEFIANKFTGEKGILFTAKYVQRFNDMEKQTNNPLQNYLNMSEEDRAIAFFTKSKEAKMLQAKLEENKEKVSFANNIESAKSNVSMKQFADLLNIKNFGRTKLFAWLRNNGYLNSNNEPYRRYVEQGIFETKEKVVQMGNFEKITITTFVTGKGQLYLHNKIIDDLKVA